MNSTLLTQLLENTSIEQIAEFNDLKIIDAIKYIRSEINSSTEQDILDFAIGYIQFGAEYRYGYGIQLDIFDLIFSNLSLIEGTQFELSYGMVVDTVLPQSFEPLSKYESLYKHNVVNVGQVYPSRRMECSICGNFDLSPYYGNDTFCIEPGIYAIESCSVVHTYDNETYIRIKLTNTPIDLYFDSIRVAPMHNELSKKYYLKKEIFEK